MRKSPREKIIELAGGPIEGKWSQNSATYKGKVLDQIVDYLEPAFGEDSNDLKARLLGGTNNGSISNKKLLKLYNTSMRLKNDFGGKKSNVVDALMKARPKDNDYRTHLEKKTTATLILLHDHARKAGDIE